MAIVTDNLSYESSYTPFERPPEAVTLNSLIPRGMRRFFFSNDISAKPVNDQIIFYLTATLPDAFAYVMTGFTMKLEAARANDWATTALLRMFNHIPGQPLGNQQTITVDMLYHNPSSLLPSRTASDVDLSQLVGPFWSTHAGSVSFRVEMSNIVATVDAAGFLFSHVDFLEYDLVQAQRYFMNSPISVLQR